MAAKNQKAKNEKATKKVPNKNPRQSSSTKVIFNEKPKDQVEAPVKVKVDEPTEKPTTAPMKPRSLKGVAVGSSLHSRAKNEMKMNRK